MLDISVISILRYTHGNVILVRKSVSMVLFSLRAFSKPTIFTIDYSHWDLSLYEVSSQNMKINFSENPEGDHRHFYLNILKIQYLNNNRVWAEIISEYISTHWVLLLTTIWIRSEGVTSDGSLVSRIINYNMCVAMRYKMRVIRWTLSLVLEFDTPHVWNFLIFLY